MEKKLENDMETGIIGFIGVYQGCTGLYGDNGKERGNYYNGLYRV